MTLDGICRSHDELLGVLLIGLLFGNLAVFELDHALCMSDTGTHSQQARGIELLRDLEGKLCKRLALSGIRRLQHRNLGADGVMTGILLILGRMHSRIVCHANN